MLVMVVLLLRLRRAVGGFAAVVGFAGGVGYVISAGVVLACCSWVAVPCVSFTFCWFVVVVRCLLFSTSRAFVRVFV